MHQNLGKARELEDAGTEWLRVGTEERSFPGPLAPPLAHENQGFRPGKVASEKAGPQRHQERLRAQARSPPEIRGIE